MPPDVPAAESPAGPVLDRAIALVVVTAAVAVVVVLASVQPDPRGLGTHEQLGMEACSWPEALGAPCPTCGVTTAASHLVHLSPARAVTTQPFGAALAVAGLLLAALAARCLWTGRSFVARLALLPYGTLMGWGLVLLLGSWLFKYLTFAP